MEAKIWTIYGVKGEADSGQKEEEKT